MRLRLNHIVGYTADTAHRLRLQDGIVPTTCIQARSFVVRAMEFVVKTKREAYAQFTPPDVTQREFCRIRSGGVNLIPLLVQTELRHVGKL